MRRMKNALHQELRTPAAGLGRGQNRMPKYKKGDKVRVRADVVSPYRGRIGTVNEEPTKDAYWYMLKFESKGFARTHFFTEQDLELPYSDKVLV